MISIVPVFLAGDEPGFLAGGLQGSRVFLPGPVNTLLIRRRALREGASLSPGQLAELHALDLLDGHGFHS
jgi:hypothetical protein